MAVDSARGFSAYNAPNFVDTVPLDGPLFDDHSSYAHPDTEVIDSDCDDHRGNGPDSEFEQEEVVLDSEDEEINGSRLVIVTKPTLDGLVGRRTVVGNEKDRSERDGGLARSGDGIGIQEHEDWSQEEALDFVDNFVSINNVELSPRIGYTKTSKKRSSVVLGENGPQKLARKINMNNPVKGSSNFDWFEEKESPRGEVKLASDFNEETRVTNPEDDATLGDAFDGYDVGFDTQIAAEAIEALASAHSLNACPVVEEKVDNLLTEFKEYNRQTSVSDDSGEQRAKQKKHSERKFRRCNFSAPKKQCGNPELKKLIEDIEKSTAKEFCSLATTNEQFKGNSEKVSPLTRESRDQGSIIRLNTTDDCRTEKMFGNSRSSLIVYTRKRSRKDANSSRVSATNAADDCRPEKMFGSTQRSIIVYRKKRSRATAKPLRVFDIGDSSKLCVPSEDSRKNNLTSLIKSGMWNFPKGKRTKCRALNDTRLNSHCRSECNFSEADGIVTNLDSISLSVVASEKNKRRQKSKHSPKTPLSKELMNLGFSEHRPEFKSKELRRRKDITNACILFSQHLDDDVVKNQKKVAARLGVSVVSCCKIATHFVADKFTRTKNMLEAIALGKPVVTHVWLESCGQANCFIDEKNYILRDSKKEKEFGFCMPVSLTHASKHPLLKDQRVLVTPNIKPNKAMIMSLVNVVQGKLVEKAPKDEDVSEDLLILSCAEDYSICVPFLHNGLTIYSSELLLNGIVTQKLEYKRYNRAQFRIFWASKHKDLGIMKVPEKPRWAVSPSNAASHFGTSGLSVAIATGITHPLDVLKVRLQMQLVGQRGPLIGMGQLFVQVVKSEGPRSLYLGLSPALMRSVLYGGMRLGLYEPSKYFCNQAFGSTNFFVKIASGLFAGAVATALTNPVEVLKVRLQMNPSLKKLGPLEELNRIVSEEGVKALWKGVNPAMVRAAALTASQLATYDETKRVKF